MGIKEYEKLEIEELNRRRAELTKQTVHTERAAIIFTGAIYGWVIQNGAGGYSEHLITLYFLQVALIVFGAWRNFSVNEEVEKIDNYLLTFESRESEKGWIKFEKSTRKNKSWLGYSAYFFWAAMILISLILAFRSL